MKKGIIVSFEGIDGCGKTTLVRKFYNYLKSQNLPVIILHEPGGTLIGEKIRKLLLSKNLNITKFCELFLYLASRVQLVEEKIKKNLEEGKIIILDRYIDSTYAYQGYGRRIPLVFIEKVHQLVIGKKFFPDITFLIDEKPENLVEILKRKGKDRIEKESIEFQKKVRNGYLQLVKKNKKIKIIKRQNEQDTFSKVLELWEQFINENRRNKKFIIKIKGKK
ncbi:MAG: dTMP kinase [Candidatus Omnitrophica bacterium]|nr:dTMP kinase [Candidatus Omnitrophota bacterium]MCM8801993.1 dTMP kinase [Candidatus Omnitrophota bacterium]